MINIRDHMISEQIRCAICHADINEFNPVFQSKVNYSIICSKCMVLFSEEEIEVALNLLILYGGYFGQYKEKKFSVIEQLLKIVDNEGDKIDIETTNMKLLHLALIHGITPKQFNHSMERFLKE